MKKFFFALNIIAGILSPLAFQTSYASTESFLEDVGTESPFSTQAQDQRNLPALIGAIIQIFLSLLAAIFVVLLIFGGYQWMTAAGDSEKAKKAKETITNAIIGLVIIVLSYAITRFVVQGLVKAVR
mgnify:CR=1 FL=1